RPRGFSATDSRPRRTLCRRGRLERDGWLTMVKILYVEDNEDNLYMLSNRLTRRGYDVVLARDGQQGIAMAGTEAPALILMDLSLPVIDGWEATRRLKAE